MNGENISIDPSINNTTNPMTKSFEERFDKRFPNGEGEGGAIMFKGWVFADDIKDFIRIEKQLSYEEGKKEERERQYDLIMSCLPSDAENLSTLTPNQAFRLIKSFISKHPWD